MRTTRFVDYDQRDISDISGGFLIFRRYRPVNLGQRSRKRLWSLQDRPCRTGENPWQGRSCEWLRTPGAAGPKFLSPRASETPWNENGRTRLP